MIPVLPRNVKCIITGNLRDTIFFFFKSDDHLGRSRSNKSQQLRGWAFSWVFL